jgi:hypothetical protein
MIRNRMGTHALYIEQGVGQPMKAHGEQLTFGKLPWSEGFCLVLQQQQQPASTSVSRSSFSLPTCLWNLMICGLCPPWDVEVFWSSRGVWSMCLYSERKIFLLPTVSMTAEILWLLLRPSLPSWLVALVQPSCLPVLNCLLFPLSLF